MVNIFKNLSAVALFNNLVLVLFMMFYEVTEVAQYPKFLGYTSIAFVVTLMLGVMSDNVLRNYKRQVLEFKYFFVMSSFISNGFVFFILVWNNYNATIAVNILSILLALFMMLNFIFAIHLITLERMYYLNYPEVVTDYKEETRNVMKETLFFIPVATLAAILAFFSLIMVVGLPSV